MVTIKVLLVDDDQSELDALCGNLAGSHYEVEAYSQPKQALARARVTKFDLAISDYRMPEMDGVMLVKALKQIQPELAVIMLCGFVELRSVKNAIPDTLVYRVLTKPWDAEKLQEMVGLVISHRVAVQPQAPAPQAKGAMAALELKYPGITLEGADWKSGRV